jgi:ribosomal protein L11 methyltransferase
MNYTKISFRIDPDTEENREILIAFLADSPIESFDADDNQLMAYIPGVQFDVSDLDVVIDGLPFAVQYSDEIIPDKNWNEVWEKNYFKRLLIANRCLIRAPFHKDYSPAEFELIIEPKMAFGTGNHETTSLVAEQILEMELNGKSVLDMGCGTGILGMLASLKGAKSVVAIDYDQWAYESTLENAQLNHIKNLTAYMGDAQLLGNELYDVIFANIHKNVILRDLPIYAKILLPNGKIILSGFYEHDLNEIRDKAYSCSLYEIAYFEKNNWIAFLLGKE